MVGPPRYNEDHPHAVDLYLVSDNSISFLQSHFETMRCWWEPVSSGCSRLVFPYKQAARDVVAVLDKTLISAGLCFSLAIQSYCSWRATLTKDWKKCRSVTTTLSSLMLLLAQQGVLSPDRQLELVRGRRSSLGRWLIANPSLIVTNIKCGLATF